MPATQANAVRVGSDIQSLDQLRATTGIRHNRAVLTEYERSYCEGKKDPWSSLGGILCAKEACIKALSGFDGLPRFSFLDLEIHHPVRGRPSLRAGGELSVWLAANRLELDVTISHSKEYAMATVVAAPAPEPAAPAVQAATQPILTPSKPAPTKVVATQHTLRARDGQALAATLFAPAGAEPARVAIIASATGVRRGLYEPYARFLARNGWAALTFDFRGIGGSLSGPIQRARASLREWGEQDLAGAIDAVAELYPNAELFLVGHSIGGQLLGILPNCTRLSAAVTVAAQHAFWWSYPLEQRIRYGALWNLVVPVVARALSYFPGKRFGLEDLPRDVALEWARWARSPHYMVDRERRPLRLGFEAFRGPVLAYSFEDDVRAPESCVRALHRYYRYASVEHRHVVPSELDCEEIGHVGFFLGRFKKTLWQQSLDWLNAQSTPHE